MLASAAAALAIWVVQPWMLAQLVPDQATWLGRTGATVASWVAALATLFLGFVLSLALTPPLSGPALERLVTLVEDELHVPTRAPTTFLQEMWCGVRAQVFAASIVLPTVTALWFLELVFPPSAVVVVPLKLMVASTGLAWNLFDYPLTLRGVRMRDRFGFIMEHRRETLGFGLAFAALFWVPCFNVLMLPVGVAAATRVIWRTLAADPTALPDLPRPRDPAAAPADAPPPDAPPEPAADVGSADGDADLLS